MPKPTGWTSSTSRSRRACWARPSPASCKAPARDAAWGSTNIAADRGSLRPAGGSGSVQAADLGPGQSQRRADPVERLDLARRDLAVGRDDQVRQLHQRAAGAVVAGEAV